MCVLAPGWLEHFFYNEYYPADEAGLFAIADAISTNTRPSWTLGSFFSWTTPGCRTPRI